VLELGLGVFLWRPVNSTRPWAQI